MSQIRGVSGWIYPPRDTFTAQGTDMPYEIPIKEAIGCLVIHKIPSHLVWGWHRWRISHRPTGRRIADVTTLKKAKVAATKLAAIAGLEQVTQLPISQRVSEEGSQVLQQLRADGICEVERGII